MSDDPLQDRITNLYKDVLAELRFKMDSMERISRNFQNKVLDIQSRLFKSMRSACRTEYEWIEQNGSIKENDGGLHIEIKEENRAEGQRYIQDFQACADKASYGIKGYFEKMHDTQQKLYTVNEQCTTSCLNMVNDKSDEQLKGCIKSCFDTTFESVERLYSDVEVKLDDISRRI